MYLWQRSIELAIPTFAIVAYSAGLWHWLRDACQWSRQMQQSFKRLQVNRTSRRLSRLLSDRAAWTSLILGLLIIGTSAWYAGLRDLGALLWIEFCWSMVTAMLNYDLTILQPTTRCRNCQYQLIGLLDCDDPVQIVTCPECGHKWSKAELCLVQLQHQSEPTKATVPAIDSARNAA